MVNHNSRTSIINGQETGMKKWYESKTIFVNALAFAAAAAAAFGFDLGLTAEVQAEIAVGVMAVVNVVLRFVTRTAVEA